LKGENEEYATIKSSCGDCRFDCILLNGNTIKAKIKGNLRKGSGSRIKIHFEKDKEANELALRVADSFPENPLLAIDILKNEETGENFVLETNLGGNTWHFSSALSRNYPGYDDAARKAAVRQYNVWDRSAEALVKSTNALAS
jgi:translation initiation factor IF-1